MPGRSSRSGWNGNQTTMAGWLTSSLSCAGGRWPGHETSMNDMLLAYLPLKGGCGMQSLRRRTETLAAVAKCMSELSRYALPFSDIKAGCTFHSHLSSQGSISRF